MLMQPGVLDSHADRSCDGDHEFEVVLLEATMLILSVNLNDTDRMPFPIPERHAHHRANLRFLDARAVAETIVGTDILAEDGLPLPRNVVEDRPTESRRDGILFPELARSQDQVVGSLAFEQDESPVGLGKDAEQRLQDPPQYPVQIDGAAEIPGNLQDGVKLLLGSNPDDLALTRR